TTPATLAVELAAVEDAPALTGEPATLANGTEDRAYTVTAEQLLQGFTDADGDTLGVTGLTADHGTVVHNADGSWTITPAANYHGPLVLSYAVSDGRATTAATLALELGAVNDVPLLTGAQATLAPGAEDQAYTVGLAQLLQGFTDADGERLSVTALTVDHGTAVQNADGSWTVTPEADYHGVLTLVYGVSDGSATVPARLVVEIDPVNDAPVLSGEPAVLERGSEDRAYTVTAEQLLQGFSDVEGAALSVSTLTVDHGTAVRNADGSWTITPEANYHGTLVLSYGVTDGQATTAATLALTLAAVNDAPRLSGAPAELAAGTEDVSYTVTLAQLLQGFTDVDSAVLSVANLTVDHGTAVQNADGSWTITPEADYHGALVLSYGVTDGRATTAATLALEVQGVNDAPELGAEPATLEPATENTAYTVTLEQLLQGFTDVDGDTLSITELTLEHGTAVQNADGSWTITPEAGYRGALTLSYVVSDGTTSTAATLGLQVVAGNEAPSLSGEPAALAAGTEDTAYTVTLAQLLQGFTDANGDALSVTGLTVDHGTAVQNPDGSWTITPEANYSGPLVLSYGVTDGRLVTGATLGLALAGVNDAPVVTGARAVLAAGTEDKAYTVTLAQLLQGFTDPDGQGLSVTSLTVDHGTAVRNADGSWTITPEADYNGALVLSYVVSDGQLGTDATLGLTLAAVNDAPVVTGERAVLAAGTEDTAYTVTLAQLLQGFGDVDSAVLSVTNLTVDHGTAVRNADGSWTITPAANYHGALKLSYGVTDGKLTTAATLGLTLASVEDVPTATGTRAQLANGSEDTAYTVTLAQLLQGFTDGDGDALSVTTLTVDHGTAVRNANGSWTITPEANYSGALVLSYGVTDGKATTAATLGLTLNAVNDAPLVTGTRAVLAAGTEDTAYTVTLAQLLQGFGDVD
ncbi:cadherin-like domain-containing protein, partial [Azohydromonas caseinilytica]